MLSSLDLLMLPFRVSVQLSVEPLIVLDCCNSQHASGITSVLLLYFKVYLN